MSFLRKLFGGGESSRPGGADDEGFFLYVQCDQCGAKVRLRVHKQHELNYTDDGFVWVKTIIDNRCFRPMQTVVHFDRGYNMVSYELEGGRYISRDEFEAPDVSEATETDQPEG